MKSIKQLSILCTFGLLFYASQTQLIANNDDFDFDDDDFSSLSFDNKPDFVQPLTRGASENAEIWAAGFELLVTDPNAAFNQSAYIKTSPLRIRPILEYPFSLTYGFNLKDAMNVSFSLTINVTPEKVFTSDSTTLDSYLDIASTSFLEDFSEELSLDPFAPTKVYEARITGLLQAFIKFNKWNVSTQLPLIYTARKLSLTDEEQDTIINSPLGDTLKSQGGGDIDKFKRDHFGVDQFGFGDFKIKAMYQLCEHDTFDAYLGGFAIFPTAAATKQGINGTWLPQNNERGYLDLLTIDPLAVQAEGPTTQNEMDFKNFILDALDKLDSNILYSTLGNNGHPVFALSGNTDWFFAPSWQLSSDLSLQIPLPSNEQRYFKRVQTEEGFLAEYNAATNTSDTALVLFVNEKIQDTLFPYVISTRVFPGVVLNVTNQFLCRHNKWDFIFGTNFWFQAEESLYNVNESSNGLLNDPTYSFDVAAATAAHAWQEKVLGQINYNLDSESYALALGLYADATILNSGIGHDFTIGLNLDYKF